MRTLIVLIHLLLVVAGLQAPAAQAAPREALQCAQSMANYYMDRGYRLRNSDSDALYQGQKMDYDATFSRGVEYVVLACGDGVAYDLDIYLYDENGNLIDRDRLTDNRPVVTVTPRWTGPFTVRVYMYSSRGPASYTMGVLYR